MQSEFQKIFQEIQADPDNESFTKQGSSHFTMLLHLPE